MSATEHERWADDVASYLLGALDADERTAFERHLETCHVCQDECARLEPAAEALPRSVEQYEPPPSLKHALMEKVHADAPDAAAATPASARRSLADRLGLTGGRGRLSPQFAAVAATFVLVVGLVAGYAISNGGSDGAATRTLAASVDTTRVGDGHAALVVGGSGAGQLRVSAMPQPRTGQVYEIWVERRGQVEPGPLFSVDRNGNGVGALPADLDGVTRVMVTRERAGGARQPTEAPVVSAKI